MAGPSTAEEASKCLYGSWILHYHGVLDAYGHLSFRNPANRDTFFMSYSIAPATVSSIDDLIEYSVATGGPRGPTSKQSFAERFIHSEIYKRHQNVNAVVHSHSEAVIPYSISGTPLRPCYHMAGFLPSSGVPVFDAAREYGPRDTPDMLVRDRRLGGALAGCFDQGNVAALMRGHGFTVVGESIEVVVMRAIYTQKNAAIQTATLNLLAAPGPPGRIPRFLNDEETKAATNFTRSAAQRAWDLWVKEVRVCGLYATPV
ncbi:arad-like aldolase/epimerase [Thozetella sp. PMI_491]|nr:arad-like aldolase/epimerase [Thozetella sp. PMI_491]